MSKSPGLLCCFWITLLAPSGCGLGVSPPGFEAERADESALLSASVSATRPFSVAGQHYEDRAAFHQSEQFKGGNYRCRAVPPATPPALAAADCSLAMTQIDPAYEPADILQIPTVVHNVVRENGDGYLDSALILSQLHVLNEDMRARAGSLGADGVDTRIEFVLADVDPDGNPTTGIERYIDNGWYDDPGPGQFNPLKMAVHWDTTRYFNLYTNDGSGGGALGYSTFAQQSAGAYDDGVVLNWKYVGRNAPTGGYYDLGRTATHEVGHYLGLLHTFHGSCGDASEPYVTGDLIADTNGQVEPNYGCPREVPSSCGSIDPLDNYMNYSQDSCMARFSIEQVNRMRCALYHYRPDLFTTVSAEAPAADFSWAIDGHEVHFTEHSVALDGAIASFAWSFGDGESSASPTPSHDYSTSAIYTVELAVTDERGAQGVHREVIQIGQSPTARFDHEERGLVVSFTDKSIDLDSAIVDWQWSFGDGGESGERNPVHEFAAPGNYQVRLTTTDEGGLSHSTWSLVPVDLAPEAGFEFTAEGLQVRFSDRTEDFVGNPTAWAWDFGDGAVSTEQNPVHIYDTGGRYSAALRVTNDIGATGMARQTLQVNAVPIASFDYRVEGLAVELSDLSRDPDGEIVARSWDFGDGTRSQDVAPRHVFAQPGHYPLTLTVVDDEGDSGALVVEIYVGEPAGCACALERRPADPTPWATFGLALLALVVLARRRPAPGRTR